MKTPLQGNLQITYLITIELMNLGNAWVEKCDKQGQHNHLTNIFSRNIEYQVLIFLYVDIVYVQHF